MKPQLILRITLCCLTLFGITATFAQDTALFRSLSPVVVKTTTKKIPNKVWKGFSTYFPYAENPRLYKVNKDYLARFMIYDEENRALLTRRGNLIYHISYGFEKSLPASLDTQIKAVYPSYQITKAIKIKEAGREIWVVNLEDVQTFILLRLEDGELEEVEHFKRSF
jgi:hypothetical protein